MIQSLGLNGVWKLGQPCSIRLRLPDELSRPVASIEVTTVDGDAVEVVYRTTVSDQTSREWNLPIRIGRRNSILSVGLVDSDGHEIVREDRALVSDEGLSPTQPLIVAIGSSLGVEELVRTSADGKQSSISVVEISEPNALPQTWLDYQAADLIVLAANDENLLKQIDASQWEAIDSWIRRGGGCVVSLGLPSERLLEFETLSSWFPGELGGEGQIRNPAALESLVNTDQPIDSFPAVLLRATSGQTRMNLSDTQGRTINWWVSVPRGFGTMQVIASDIGHPSLANWKHRRLFWERLVASYFDKTILDGTKVAHQANANSYRGYSDLTGQLRATLEQFPGVRVISFSQIAAMLVAILLVIGPLDYFVSVRWLKRPHLSWFFTGSVLLASSLGLVSYYQSLRPDQVLVNSAQLVDVDAQTGRVDGHLWGHIYSARARRVSVEATSGLGDTPLRLDWQGLPGTGLGGLESAIRLERGMPSYVVKTSHENASTIEGAGIPAAGTKSFYGVWTEQLPSALIDSSRSNLRELPSVDQLEGELVNPLDVDIRDAMIFYHRWFYWLKSRLPAGDRIVLSSSVIPRDISRRLNRQQEIDGKMSSSRWDPADRNDLDRLLELMMFHKAATGENYTSLTHRYQPIMDHSNVLESNYAVLIGRLDECPAKWTVELEDSEATSIVRSGTERAWVRILWKVDPGKGPNRRSVE